MADRNSDDADGVPSPRMESILQHVPRDAERVLDLGCVRHDPEQRRKFGHLHQELCQHVSGEVVGIDILADEVESMRDEGYDVRVADAEDFDLEETFDVCVAGDIIEHLGRPQSMLECAREHLSDDGRLIISTPNVWCWFFCAQTFRGHVHSNEEHKCWYDKRTLGQLLEFAGYSSDVKHVVGTPESVAQPWLRRLFAVVNRSPLPRLQRASALLAVAEPDR